MVEFFHPDGHVMGEDEVEAELLLGLFGQGIGLFATDLAGVGEDRSFIEPQELIELGPPVAQENLLTPRRRWPSGAD